jgi:MFS family permease
MAGAINLQAETGLNEAQTNRRALLLAIMVCFGGFVFGLDAALVSGTKTYVMQDLGTDAIGYGYAVSAPGLGVVFALLVTGHICDRIGRRKTLLLIGWLYLLSAVCAVFSQTLWQLVAARFLGGLAFASLSVSSMYVGEVAPPAKRGLLVAVNQLNIVFGCSRPISPTTSSRAGFTPARRGSAPSGWTAIPGSGCSESRFRLRFCGSSSF